MRVFLLVLLFFACVIEATAKNQLTIARIFDSPELSGKSPMGVKFSSRWQASYFFAGQRGGP